MIGSGISAWIKVCGFVISTLWTTEVPEMRSLLARLWGNDGGALITLEWVFVAAILLLGAVTGLVAVRQAVLTEFTDAAHAVFSLYRPGSFAGRGEGPRRSAGPAQARQAAASDQRACD
jgi:hypothetical protein